MLAVTPYPTYNTNARVSIVVRKLPLVSTTRNKHDGPRITVPSSPFPTAYASTP